MPTPLSQVLLSGVHLDAICELAASRRKLLGPLIHLLSQSLVQRLPKHPKLCAKYLATLLGSLPAGALQDAAVDLAAELLDVAAAHPSGSDAPAMAAAANGTPRGAEAEVATEGDVGRAVQRVLR